MVLMVGGGVRLMVFVLIIVVRPVQNSRAIFTSLRSRKPVPRSLVSETLMLNVVSRGHADAGVIADVHGRA